MDAGGQVMQFTKPHGGIIKAYGIPTNMLLEVRVPILLNDSRSISLLLVPCAVKAVLSRSGCDAEYCSKAGGCK